MRKIPLGLLSGTVLGILDGLSAFFVPEAAGMMTTIMVGSTVKGLVGGLAAGLIARRSTSIAATAAWSAVVGVVLSVLAAIPSGAYVQIVIPGTIVGLLTGAITQKWGR
jgi:hypothetical protein